MGIYLVVSKSTLCLFIHHEGMFFIGQSKKPNFFHFFFLKQNHILILDNHLSISLSPLLNIFIFSVGNDRILVGNLKSSKLFVGTVKQAQNVGVACSVGDSVYEVNKNLLIQGVQLLLLCPHNLSHHSFINFCVINYLDFYYTCT